MRVPGLPLQHFLFLPVKLRLINTEHVIEFWQEVMDALGPNIKIAVVEGGIRVEDVRVEEVKVKDVKESKPMATVFCHFEWGDDKKKLPFTKGCRFFWFREDKEGRLIISKVTGLEELPLKPGELVLVCMFLIQYFVLLFIYCYNRSN
ncbi:hypothetical protein GLYMA_06G124250v4 [Glycine max]|uniref:uncharacterized protein isoform X1 n=1 Tax=Glycine max TaxID=3847 RepID=UPI000E21BE62|nr:uncharacterized protein LOC102667048 isoform X1 [Glycine max]KAG4389620.1 hypothetical protein GLYMA_06G124250v4 [Glycine max]KAG4389621.1 hypothetical protein GLYMA_06G124250v4 [Glycine max]KAH1125537.1 hypothetical protein GYH30_014895 [Glycine max]KAH1125538.1 hypothetical protein GYH30_014895 [Glycine max]|eukprot:XP_025984569.1 uncharacterized protein LOC102667048 isoform X1 [Glycine max]